MKPGILPPSQNIVDQRMNTSAQAPHTSDPNGNDIINNSKMAQRDQWMQSSQKQLQQIMQMPNNPFRKMLMDMTVNNMVKPQQNAKIPIPMPSPGPNSPPAPPPPYDNGKG